MNHVMSETTRTRHWIDNEWVEPASGATFPDHNPATGEHLAEVAAGDAVDVDRAVHAARSAFRSSGWRRMNPHKRAALLWKLADLIEANADELAPSRPGTTGKPYFESRKVDLPSVVENFRYFAGMAATRWRGRPSPWQGPYFTYTVREPLGVVGMHRALELPPLAGGLEGGSRRSRAGTPWCSSRPRRPP
jgi:aldehyde dehydrogenase (NAD+)